MTPQHIGLEQVLAMLASSVPFRYFFFKDREKALLRSGLPFTPTEREILLSTPKAVLDQQVAALASSLNPSQLEWFGEQAAGTLELDQQLLHEEWLSHLPKHKEYSGPTKGIRPDRHPARTLGIRPEKP